MIFGDASETTRKLAAYRVIRRTRGFSSNSRGQVPLLDALRGVSDQTFCRWRLLAEHRKRSSVSTTTSGACASGRARVRAYG